MWYSLIQQATSSDLKNEKIAEKEEVGKILFLQLRKYCIATIQIEERNISRYRFPSGSVYCISYDKATGSIRGSCR